MVVWLFCVGWFVVCGLWLVCCCAVLSVGVVWCRLVSVGVGWCRSAVSSVGVGWCRSVGGTVCTIVFTSPVLCVECNRMDGAVIYSVLFIPTYDGRLFGRVRVLTLI